MQINAVNINTSGLGGDSRISFTRDRHITIGPMRNIPVCCSAAEYPHIAQSLAEMRKQEYQSAQDTSLLDIILYSPGWQNLSLSADEARLCNLLERKKAVFAAEARETLGLASVELLHLPALEAAGAIKRSHITPTDIFHIQGKM